VPNTQRPGNGGRASDTPGREAGFEAVTREQLQELATSELGGVVLSRTLLSDVGLWVTFLAREPDGERVLLNIRPRNSLDDVATAQVFSAADANRDVHHPSVLSVRRFGTTDELLWITTLGFGGRLLLPSSSPNSGDRVSRAMEFFRQVAGPLDAVHAAGLVHGALTRSAFHLDTEGYVRIRNVDIETPVLRACLEAGIATVAGACAAPEVRKGAEPGPESDQYALASLLVTDLTGRPPGPAGELPKEGVPDAMRPILERALLTDRKKRFPSVLALWEVLDAEGFSVRTPADDLDVHVDLDAGRAEQAAFDGAVQGEEYVPSAFRSRTGRRSRSSSPPEEPPPGFVANDPFATPRGPLGFPEPWADDEPRGSGLWSRALSAAVVLLLLSGSFELFFSDSSRESSASEDSLAVVAEREGTIPEAAAPPGGSASDSRGERGTFDDTATGASEATSDSASEAEAAVRALEEAEARAREEEAARAVEEEATRAREEAAARAREAASVPAPPPTREPSRATPAPPEPSLERREEMALIPGSLSLQTYPWGAVYVDGNFVGNSPLLDVRVAPGIHTIRVERQGYEPYLRELTVQPGQALRLTGIVLTRGGDR
jgi:serine/threonine protein kinase